MKAELPDKIYCGDNGGGELSYATIRYDYMHEYIRKDTLLEWAKGEKMPGNSAEGKGWNWALQTLIDKLESL